MSRPLNLKGPSSREDVEREYAQTKHPGHMKRLLAVLMGLDGSFTMEQIGRAVGYDRSTIIRWFAAFRAGGVPRLLHPPRRGRGPKGRIGPEVEGSLRKELEAGRFKSVPELRRWLKQQHAVQLSASRLYTWLRQRGARWKVPRPAHDEQDPEAVQRWKTTFARKLRKLIGQHHGPVRIWVLDEQRHGLISTVRRCWTLRGHRPRVPYRRRYQWAYTFGALELLGAGAEFLFTPSVCLEWTAEFIKLIVATAPQALHILIWDGAGFHHRPGDQRLPDSVRVLTLPPYTPELNPVETLWDRVAEAVSNTVWQTLGHIQQAIEPVLQAFWSCQQRVRSLLGDFWVHRKVHSLFSPAQIKTYLDG